MAFLTREEIINTLDTIKNGRLARICYETEVPVKAEYRKAGIKVLKTVEKTVRIGIYYGSIASVKAKALEVAQEVLPSKKKENPFEWVIKNRIRKHKVNGTEYLQIARLKDGANKKEKFKVIIGADTVYVKDRETFESYNFDEYVLPSHWNYDNTKAPSEVQYISLDNIVHINHNGEDVSFE